MDANFKTDRRYQRTHELIINSTIELARISGWSKVSVTKLAEKANINRNSFPFRQQFVREIHQLSDAFGWSKNGIGEVK